MWRARALVAIFPLSAVVAALLMGAHPEPTAQALPVHPAAVVATTTSTSPTSTTMAPPATTTTTAPAPVVHPAHKTVQQTHTAASSWPCGGDLPPCWVLAREDPDGDPTIYNGRCHAPPGYAGPGPCGSTASGLWQFLRSTWANFGGYLNAADAPPDVQNAKARELWAGGRGCAHWTAC